MVKSWGAVGQLDQRKLGKLAGTLLLAPVLFVAAACGSSEVVSSSAPTVSTTIPDSVSTTVPVATNPTGSSTTIADSSDVTTFSPSTDDIQGITAAFNSWEELPSTCLGQIVPGTTRFATIISTGVSWAIAGFEPPTNCVKTMDDPPQTVPIDEIWPWGEVPSPPIGVFERQPSGSWSMNQQGGQPFPCPAAGGIASGPGNGALPPPVVAAWGLTYASDCANVVYPDQPDFG